jgi:ribulose-5-phosphate 4-epimerase/fuculose-1-phosphate aldolase
MFLRNHGLVILGETIEEAFFRACNTVLACESQIRMMPVGLDNLIMISEDAKRRSQVPPSIPFQDLSNKNTQVNHDYIFL